MWSAPATVRIRWAMTSTVLHRLLQNGAHPLDLQLGIEGGGNVLEHQPQRVVQTGGGKEEAQIIEEGQLPGQ